MSIRSQDSPGPEPIRKTGIATTDGPSYGRIHGNILKNPLIVFLLSLCSACTPETVFEKYRELPAETWNRYHAIEFITHIPDSGLYRVQLRLRHTTDYGMTDLWCLISARSILQTEFRDTLDMKIAEPEGRWIGKGEYMKTVEQDIGTKPVFLPPGRIVFRIRQGMPAENLKGIKNIGLRISKADTAPGVRATTSDHRHP